MGANKIELKRGDELHACTQIILNAGENMMRSFYSAGVALKKVRDEELWRESYESFESYYTDLGFERSRVYRAIQTVEKLPLKEVKDMQLGKLYAILPTLTDANKSEMVKMAQSLSISDLYHQLKTKRAVEAEPKSQPLPKIYPCSKCGKARGIQFIDLCHCNMNEAQQKYIQTIINKVEEDDYQV